MLIQKKSLGTKFFFLAILLIFTEGSNSADSQSNDSKGNGKGDQISDGSSFAKNQRNDTISHEKRKPKGKNNFFV